MYEESKSRQNAVAFVKRITDFCQDLAIAPFRGEERLGASGLRTIGFERKASVAFYPDAKRKQVIVIGTAYGGRNPDFLIDRRA